MPEVCLFSQHLFKKLFKVKMSGHLDLTLPHRNSGRMYTSEGHSRVFFVSQLQKETTHGYSINGPGRNKKQICSLARGSPFAFEISWHS